MVTIVHIYRCLQIFVQFYATSYITILLEFINTYKQAKIYTLTWSIITERTTQPHTYSDLDSLKNIRTAAEI